MSNLLSSKDLQDLKKAKEILENPGLTMKVANYIGKPIEFAIDKIDSDTLNKATSIALRKSLDLAISTLGEKESKFSNLKHKLLVATSGAGGGFFGIATLPIELPISTTIMLRSIANIAKSQGHNLKDPEVKFSCLEVFSLGSTTNHDDDAGESAYFTARAGLAYEMKLAINSVVNMSNKTIQDALAKGNMPMLIKLINSIASRFGITVSEKLVAQTIPFIGALGGASLNVIFINHFQDMAKGHFIVKRLEKQYGEDKIKNLYLNI